MRITYWGHSACLLETKNHKIVIDPFLSGNPRAALDAADVECDFIFLTHGHADHLGDAIPIAKRTGATIVANFELAQYCAKAGLQTHGMNHGGRAQFEFGIAEMTNAVHSSSIEDANGNCIYLGNPSGFIFEADGKTVYHAGDTALTYDMKLLGEVHNIDVAILPIGANFTMGVRDADRAVEFLKPSHVIPVHYNTFPSIVADPSKLEEKHSWGSTMVHALESGQSIEI